MFAWNAILLLALYTMDAIITRNLNIGRGPNNLHKIYVLSFPINNGIFYEISKTMFDPTICDSFVSLAPID